VLWIAGRPAYGSELTTTVGFVPPALVNEEGGQIPGPAYVAGIRAGDRIIAIDGQKVGSWTEISEAVLFGAGRTSEGERLTRVTLERDGVQQVVDVRPVVLEPEGLRQLGLLPKQRSFIDG
jgi:regulator of sigma E protease